jgi:hypothetical protein
MRQVSDERHPELLLSDRRREKAISIELRKAVVTDLPSVEDAQWQAYVNQFTLFRQ